MDADNSNGNFKRSSMQQALPQRPPMERNPSKKSSRDRHAAMYPDTFRDTGIRTVTPESHSPISDTDYLNYHSAPSPRTTMRSRTVERREEDTQDMNPRRTRSRTATMDENRKEPKPQKSRTRINSLHASSSTKLKAVEADENDSNSIGFPSIQPPNYIGQAISRNGRASTVAHSQEAFASPISNTDAAKILQLMKTTCGRMHGILSFKDASNSTWSSNSWISGYCAINVATGSLIYQAKGEPALAKTLIPDLRGCRVRSLFDPELQTTYLSVHTSTSGLGIQLRPHVNETFDSWLAALLCWQPIRPKGVQNKMTKPQSVLIGDKRIPEPRRNSETASQNEAAGSAAAIIKVGKMLLWDKPSAAGVRPTSARRVSTYRQSRALSSNWQHVSCTLQENGWFKLYTENEPSLVAFIQLSQLSRCAVQQLDSSVLDDEFCIAIYPQYTAHPVPDAVMRPIYLALETRILFEAWFVLLRAFTIPELYGPKASGNGAEEDDPNKTPEAGASSSSASSSGMFRFERILHLRITEAKLFRTKDEETPRSRKTSRSHANPAPSPPKASDYYTEVLLDGEIRAKTAVKYRTTNPFWREEFTFNDLPPVLSQASILIKNLNPAQRDWTLIAHGNYSGQGVNAVNMLDEIEVSTNDSIIGRVDLRLDELDPGVGLEKWWPILDDHDQPIGEMFMKAHLEETVVLMSEQYEPLKQLLHNFTNGLTVNMAQVMSSELTQLSEMLLNIFQVSGSTVDWISALVEDEIDGVHRRDYCQPPTLYDEDSTQ
ncbi:hypothetical protein N7468_005037 [Penicillium chermesinum]|uniref:C2 domain-containing protein n=1 Tax=Penicillium chermesinum TaxID=63820 RepID=A0A9W9NYF1_9EURO|nr:uncharacterized protein N7468_005037 [Penicillium chermesinum]KAJ5232081.1 hypothetical protein N7468_005037 [Penicillium chermesinum]